MENKITNMEWLCTAIQHTRNAHAGVIEAMESVESLFGKEIALYEMLSDINDQLTAMADLCYEIDGGRQDIEPEDLQNFLTSDK